MDDVFSLWLLQLVLTIIHIDYLYLEIPEASDLRIQELWKKIWKVDIPNCVPNFCGVSAEPFSPPGTTLEGKV